MSADHRSSITPDDFQSIISISMDGFLLVDMAGNILEANESYCQLMGYQRDQLISMHVSSVDAIDSHEVVAKRVATIQESGSLRFETKHRQKTGTIIDFEVSANYSASHGGIIFSFLRDISSQTRNREIMSARLRLLEYALSHSLHELLRKTLDELEILTGSCIGFYHFLDDDQETLTLQQWSTKTLEVFCKAEGSGFHYSISQAGVWVDCVRERRPVIHNDYASLAHCKGMPKGHAPVLRELVVPIFRFGKIVAILGVGNKPTDYIQHDIEVITTLADLAWEVAELKQVQEALRKSEEKFRTLADNAPVGIYLTDPNGDCVYTNKFWQEIAGVTAEEAAGKGWEKTLHPEERHQIAENWYRSVQSRGQWGYEYRFLTPQGKLTWVHGTAFPLLDADNQITGYIGTNTDITEQKLATMALAKSESTLNASQSLAKVGGWEWDVVQKTMFWSDEVYRIHDIDPAGIVPGSPEHIEKSLDCYNPDDRQKILDAFQRCALHGEAYDFDLPFTTTKGRKLWIRTIAGPVKDGERIVKVVGSIMDITERKKSEEAISSSNKLLQTIINTAPVRVFWKDIDLRYLGCNLAFAKDAGVLHPDDLIGKDDFQLGWRDQAELYRNDDRSVIESGLPKLSYDEPQTTPDGNHIWLRTSKVPLKDEKNKIIGILGIYDDITKWKLSEEEKQNLERQFLHAQKLESLGVLAGGIAHDFNNILAIIIGHCSLAAMNPEAASDHIPKIEKAADRAAGLCRQMLAYAGKATSTLTQINIVALTDEMVNMLKATINQNVSIKPDLSSDIPAINGDASQLRQIVMNLIINASEAIGEEQGVINVSLTKKEINSEQSSHDYLGKEILPGFYACLEVSDNGCGMDDETIRRIFEPFYTTKFTGRGLGMSAVLGIVNGHKGALQLTSQQGQGTTFTIYLPIEISQQTDGESCEQMLITPWQGSGTVLLVEDEEMIVTIASAMLKELGFAVIEASNGKEALELYQKNAADIVLVVTDLGMPVMDGYTLFRELKSVNPELPIIISSGFGDTVVTARIPCEEIAGLVSKPYRFDQLRDVLKNFVEGAVRSGLR